MKKFLLLIAAAAMSLGAYATDYKGLLGVTVSPISPEEGQTPTVSYQEANVTLVSEGDKASIQLKNFILDTDETTLPVGNINVDDCEVVERHGYSTISFDNAIQLQEGDADALPEGMAMWYGPFLGDVPINMTAFYKENLISVNITISLVDAGLNINVNFVGENPEAAPQPQGNKFDVNSDGKVDVGDVNGVLDEILNPTTPPAAE
ncbi:MAG: hypothetical protein IJU62_02860 [Muribaculaceae bacterium]|nr:hypothetical protein [Muribaculaceae bacterium]